MSERSAPADPPEPDLDSALAEYLRRLDAGEEIDRWTLDEEQPELAAALWQLLCTADLVNRMAGPTVEDEERDAADSADAENSLGGDADASTVTFAPDEDAAEALVEETLIAPRPSLEPGDETVVATSTDAPGDHLLGQTFGDYELLEVIGRGGMGVVYKARQISMDRMVAVKMIQGGSLASPEDVQRFYTEAQAAGKTGHPNIVNVYQIGEHEGRHFFSMDYVEGADLAQISRAGPLEPRRAALYLKTIADAIHEAHESGILHRDLKPANVLIDSDDRPMVTDFGLAKQVDDPHGLTTSGAAMGTPSYMSPEQASGRHHEVDASSDVYSLGAILYALLTGEPPFRGTSAVKTMMDVIHREPEPPRSLNSAADVDLETICLKCLEKDPRKRYGSAAELSAELDRFLNDQPILAKPRTPLERAWLWVRDMPLVAAALGRVVANPSERQVRAQYALLILLPMFLWMCVLIVSAFLKMMPRTIHIGSGASGGAYHAFAEQFATALRESAKTHTVDVKKTSGSGENLEGLLARTYDLTLLQASHLQSDRVAVVAPLYYEYVHVIARHAVKTIQDIGGKTVALGKPGSGSRANAETILAFYGIDNVVATDECFDELTAKGKWDAAFVTTGLGSEVIKELLKSGEFHLLDLPKAIDILDPQLRPTQITADAYANMDADVFTIATPALLVTRPDAPRVLVREALETLYKRMKPDAKILDKQRAGLWHMLPYHPAAAEYLFREK